MKHELSEISAVVCTWDAENIIEECLSSLRRSGVGEIIVVDADFCDRMVKQWHSFAVSDAIVWEIGSENIRPVIYRWMGYGRSDWEVYRKYSSSWPFRRKIRSLTHPLRMEFITPFLRSPGWSRVYILPFLFLITGLRYFSWVKHAIFELDKK